MSETPVDVSAVRHVAELARIDLDEDAAETFPDQFGEILEHFEQLEEVPAVERDPALQNVLRVDEARDSLSQAEALSNAEDSEDGRFKAPPVS